MGDKQGEDEHKTNQSRGLHANHAMSVDTIRKTGRTGREGIRANARRGRSGGRRVRDCPQEAL
jgi:hypothetical protein